MQGKCGPTVGMEEVGPAHVKELPGRGAKPWAWWYYNVGQYSQGRWFSTTGEGRCNSATSDDAPCYWRVAEVIKRVPKNCTNSLVQAAVTARGKDCFQSCPQPSNATSTCFIGCFFETLMGPASGSGLYSPSEAMPVNIVEDAFNQGFEADPSQGGCPSV